MIIAVILLSVWLLFALIAIFIIIADSGTWNIADVLTILLFVFLFPIWLIAKIIEKIVKKSKARKRKQKRKELFGDDVE